MIRSSTPTFVGYALLIAITSLFMSAPAWAQNAPEKPTSFGDRILALHDKIVEESKTTSNLTEKDLASLPVGIYKEVAGASYMIIVDSAKFTPDGAFFNAYIVLEFKATGKRIAFAGKNIAFHPGGLASSSDSRLVLVSEERINIVSNKIELVLPADNGNFVQFDCNGFKSVNLKGFFEFDESFLIPAQPDDNAQAAKAPEKVRASFEVSSTDWGSLMATVNMSPFQIPQVKGLMFSVRDAVMDFSDIANPPDFEFPVDYTNTFGDNINHWEGFMLRELEVTLFDELKTERGRQKITAQNVLIDKSGVSGSFGTTTLFGRDEGTLNGWPFSVDSLGVVLVKNQLKGGAMKGLLEIPMLDGGDPLHYSAFISQGAKGTDYGFSISAGRTIKASVLAANIELLPASTFMISKVDGKLKPEAILHGSASIGAEGANLKKLKFTDLHLTSEAPYVLSGHWAFASANDPDKPKEGNDIGNFPIVIQNLEFTHGQGMLKLQVDAILNLMNSSDKGFAARATVAVTGALEASQEMVGEQTVTRQKWKYKGTQISDISIDINGGVYKIKGRLSIYRDDKVYGNGFRGEVDATFTPGPQIKAVAQFGTVNGMRYWYVDGMVRLPAPIGTGFGFYGFGGGMYYHMILQKPDVYAAKDMENKTGDADKQNIGATRSGSTYVPSAEIGLGLKATVILGTIPSPMPFNEDVTFEIAFNATGGVRLIRLRGEAYFITPIENRSGDVPLYADIDIIYDFKNSSLHANMDVYVNIAGGLIRGIHPGNLAGSAVMHFDPDQWYIHIGTPEQRVGLNFVGIMQAGSYFMVGSYIHDFPAPPKQVSAILGGVDLDFMRDENALATGGGFAFGAGLEINIPRLELLIFYGEFSAGAGFDIMLRNYGETHCKGESGPIGINGWYASGQAWAYMQGSIGVFVDLTFIKGEFEILRIAAAAVLQAKLPNPLWMQGIVGGEFSILGGLVSGNCRFKVTIGSQCELEGVNSLTGVKVIAEMQPAKEAGEVNVFTAPQVAFNVPVAKEFELMDNDNNYKAYRIRLDKFIVSHDGKALAGRMEWNEKHDVVLFKSTQILPPKATLRSEIKVTWEESINGAWQVMGAGDKTASEEQTIEFQTGEAPKNIPEENVQYSYPMLGQYNFFTREYGEGYLKTITGQDYLFNPQVDGKQWQHVARFTATGQTASIDVPITYDAGALTVRYAIPDLARDKMYVLTFVKVPISQDVVDENVTSDEQTLVAQEDGNNVKTQSKDIEGTSYTSAQERSLYDSYLRTSKFTTFNEKLNSMTAYTSVGSVIPGIQIFEPGAWGYLPEVFDRTDLRGLRDMKPLIELHALTNNSWYNDRTYPLVYEYYPAAPELTIGNWRSIEPAGAPPLDALSIDQTLAAPSLAKEDVFGNAALANPAGRVTFVYSVSVYAYKDYYELKNKAFDRFVTTRVPVPTGAYRLMTTPYSDIINGQYQFNVQYRLPGLDTITTTRTFTIDW